MQRVMVQIYHYLFDCVYIEYLYIYILDADRAALSCRQYDMIDPYLQAPAASPLLVGSRGNVKFGNTRALDIRIQDEILFLTRAQGWLWALSMHKIEGLNQNLGLTTRSVCL
eukprot:SAG31_NODE_2150_length_6327_cov_4.325947_5_plen_112_part_00